MKLGIIGGSGFDDIECAFVIDLSYLKGKNKLEQAGYKAFNIIEFEGE